MIEVVDARLTHVGPIATRMRAIDALECAIMGRTPKQALRQSLAGSALVWTVLINGRPEAMMGVAPICTMTGEGSPWMLMTDEAVKHARALVVLGREYTAKMLVNFPLLANRVHADNATAIRWLERLDYVIGPTVDIGGHSWREFSLCVSPPVPSP